MGRSVAQDAVIVGAATVALGVQTHEKGGMTLRVVIPSTTVARWAIGLGNVDPKSRKQRPMLPKMMNHIYCWLRQRMSRRHHFFLHR
jgi:hypothetical protein